MPTPSHAPTDDRTEARHEPTGEERVARAREEEIADIQKLLGEIQGTWSELVRSMRELRECLEDQAPPGRREG